MDFAPGTIAAAGNIMKLDAQSSRNCPKICGS
jgi:hypothetical protein